MSKAFVRSIKNVTNGYTSAQVKVRNATSNEPYGPSTSEMEDIADLTYEHVEFLEVMDILSRRLNDKGKNWRHVAKALTVLDFIVRVGSENVVLWSKDNMYIIKTLREFQYVDEDGHDQGTIIRVKAKELTSLLRDDERLRAERSMRNDRRRRRRPQSQRRSSVESQEGGADDDEDELARALEESRRTAEEEERRRNRNVSDDGLSTALQLSREEEEARRAREAQQQNLLDLSDPQPGQQFDIFGNPINSMNTGYLQNAYGGDYMQQLQQQQYLQQQQQQEYLQQQQLQQQQQEYLQQQYLQQQQQQQQQQQEEYLQQQQYLQYLQQQQQQQQLQQQQQQQQLEPLKTGSNNPFAINNEPSSTGSAAQFEHKEQPKLNRTPTASQKKNEEYSDLNTLLATGTGIDTFGNEGNLRIPAQFTKPTTFINSSGTGIRTDNNSANPFIQKQYTGVASTGIVPSYTGYGFGNQASQPQQRQQQGSTQAADQSLIDI